MTTKILLIEDNPGDSRLFELILFENGKMSNDLFVAGSLREAQEATRRHKFDIVFLDLGLPESTGMNTLISAQKFIRACPIIVLTGLNDESTASQALQAGAQDYLVKGEYDYHQLKRAKEYAISRYLMTQENIRLRNFYENIVSSVSEGIMIVGDHGIVEFSNLAATKILGISRVKLRGFALKNIFIGDEWSGLQKLIASQKIGNAIQMELDVRNTKGERIPVSLSSTKIQYEGIPKNLVVLTDIRQQRKYQTSLQEKSAQLSFLYEAGKKFNETLKLATIFSDVYQLLSEAIPCDVFYIFTHDHQQNALICDYAVADGNELDVTAFPHLSLQEADQNGYCTAIQQKRTIPINDYHHYFTTSTNNYFVDERGSVRSEIDTLDEVEFTRASMIVPMFNSGKSIGVLQLFSYQAEAYTEKHLNLVENLSSQLSITIKNALLYQQAQDEIVQRKAAEDSVLLQAQMLENVGQAVIATDLTGAVIFWNAAAEAIYGWTREDAMGKNILSLTPALDMRAEAENIMATMKLGTPWTGEMRLKRKSGDEFSALITNSPVLNAENELIGIVGISVDLTELKKQEENIRKSEQKYRLLADNSLDVIVLLTPSFEFKYLSPALKEVLGYEVIELANTSLFDKVHPDDSRNAIQAYKKQIQSGGSFTLSFRFMHHDGHYIWLETIGTLVWDQNSGKVLEIQAISRDVTERKNLLDQLAYEQVFTKATIDALSANIAVIDTHGNIIAVNKAWVDFGLTNPPAPTQNGLGMNYLAICDNAEGEDIELARQAGRVIRKVISGDSHLEVHEYPCHSPNDKRWFKMIVSPFADGQHFVIAHENVTPEKSALGSLSRRLSEMEMVNHITRYIRESTDEDALFEFLIEQLAEVLQIKDVLVSKVNAETNSFFPIKKHGWFEKCEFTPLTIQEGLVGQVIKAKRHIEIQNFGSDPYFIPPPNGCHPEKASGLAFPVLVDSQAIYAIMLSLPDPREFSEQEKNVLISVVDMIENAVHRIRLLDSALTLANDLLALNEFSRYLAETHDEYAIYQNLDNLISELFPDTFSLTISRYDTSQKSLRNMFIREGRTIIDPINNTEARLGTEDKFSLAKAITKKRPVFFIRKFGESQEQKESTQRGRGDQPSSAEIYVPLVAKGAVLGIMKLVSHTRTKHTQSNEETLVWIANTVAIALSNFDYNLDQSIRIRRQQALRTIDLAITSSFDLSVTLDVLLQQVLEQLHVDAAAILLSDKNMKTLQYAASKGFKTTAIESSRLLFGQGVSGKVASTCEPVILHTKEDICAAWSGTPFYADEEFNCFASIPLIVKEEVKGVLELFDRAAFPKDKDWYDYMEILAGQAAVAVDNANLFTDLQRSNAAMRIAYDETIEGWARALDLRDNETEGHTRRVTKWTIQLAQKFGLTNQEIVHIRRGALLHDIGKMGIPDSILHKPGPLDEAEWVLMRRHPELAYNMLKPIDFLQLALDIPYCHHEKWDGSGYPRGLHGEDIPFSARIFSVVDVWDALTSDRPYRKAWSEEKTFAYIKAQAGLYFDPKVVEMFLELLEVRES